MSIISDRIIMTLAVIQDACVVDFPTQYVQVIMAIGPHPAITLGDIAVKTRLSTSAVSRDIDALIAWGLAEKNRSPYDGRVRLATLTPRGVSVFNKMIAVMEGNDVYSPKD